MARRNKKKSARTYAQPVVSGNQTMSFDLSQARFSSAFTVDTGVDLTPNKIRALLGLNTEVADAIKITSIVFSPWSEKGDGTSDDYPWVVDFVDGQRFTIMDKMKPTKVKPSMLSPAGRWQDASSTSIKLVNIKGPVRTYGPTSSATYGFKGSIIVNVAVRQDKPTSTALAPN